MVRSTYYMLPRAVAAEPSGGRRVTGCWHVKDGEDDMTVVMTVDRPGMAEKQYVTNRAILDSTLSGENPIQIAGSIAERWRDLGARESLDMIEAFIKFAAQFVTDVAAEEPTWEDAAWQ